MFLRADGVCVLTCMHLCISREFRATIARQICVAIERPGPYKYGTSPQPSTHFVIRSQTRLTSETTCIAFIAKTPLQSRVRPNTHLVVMRTTSQCKLRCPFRNLRITNVIFIVTYYTLPPLESTYSFWMTRSLRSRRRNKGLYAAGRGPGCHAEGCRGLIAVDSTAV